MGTEAEESSVEPERRHTALGLLNHVIHHFGIVLAHDCDGDAWHPWWHGEHVSGSWRVEPAAPWWGS